MIRTRSGLNERSNREMNRFIELRISYWTHSGLAFHSEPVFGGNSFYGSLTYTTDAHIDMCRGGSKVTKIRTVATTTPITSLTHPHAHNVNTAKNMTILSMLPCIPSHISLCKWFDARTIHTSFSLSFCPSSSSSQPNFTLIFHQHCSLYLCHPHPPIALASVFVITTHARKSEIMKNHLSFHLAVCRIRCRTNALSRRLCLPRSTVSQLLVVVLGLSKQSPSFSSACVLHCRSQLAFSTAIT